MKYGYYPGCTLKKNALAFETSALKVMKDLEISFEEMPDWNCCGTSFGLSRESLIHQVAPLRNILRAREQGFDAIVTLCSICYNTLRRADGQIREDPVARRRLTNFLDEYGPYDGGFPVYHLMEVLEDRIGLESVQQKVVQPLEGLKAAPYYGCMLVRPQSLGFDSMERPGRLHRLLRSLKADPVDFPHSTECCGAYFAVGESDRASEMSLKIIESARGRGAEVLITSCPLCFYNLDQGQEHIQKTVSGFTPMPVLYFTQALAFALGAQSAELGLDSHWVKPTHLFDALEKLSVVSQETTE